MITIYTDGSCITNPGNGGWAAIINDGKEIKKISLKEKNSLNTLCRGAAIRYLLTRLYDFSNTPKTALIKIKDPNEYYQKLLSHNNLSSFKDYLN